MQCSRGVTKTIVLKSPDSDRVREVIVTSVLLPKSENERTNLIKPYRCSENIMMENRACKRRLDHLSMEEKILRKKLKNREAAQTSRDKKKARLTELEESLSQLQNENESLYEEVRSLRDEKESLARENARLAEEVFRLSVGGGISGPAASCPLLKGVRSPPALHLRLLRLLQLLLTVSTSRQTTGTGLTSCPSRLSLKSSNVSQVLSLLRLLIPRKQKQRKIMWWGRKQKAWNPLGRA